MSDETETVGILKLHAEQGFCAFGPLEEEANVRHIFEEAWNLIDGSMMPYSTEDDLDAPAFVTIEVRRMPKGWVASLPEFEGW